MGGTTYSHQSRMMRSQSAGYETKAREEIFTQREMHKDMNPKGVVLRESRDSEAHPNSIPIIIALDVTGSMGYVPHELVKKGLPKIVTEIIKAGIADPQIMFIAIGDHKTDYAPLQISQFESGDEELDMWLTNVWLEGNGGGNGGESYSLAHYFANTVCVSDNWEKRGKKGYIFTIGDEANHSDYASNRLESIFGGNPEAFTDESQLEQAKEKWNVFHIIPGNKNYNEQGYWNKFLGSNAIEAENAEHIADVISSIVVQTEGKAPSAKKQPDSNNDESKITL